MEDKKPEIVINIHGGNVQILPNATHAELHVHLCSPQEQGEAQAVQIPGDSSRLSIYINNEKICSRYVSQLQSCRSAAEVGEDSGSHGSGDTGPHHQHG